MITITLDSDDIGPVLKRLQGRMRNLRPAMAGIGMELENRVRNRFDSRTDPNGAQWAAWSPSTVESYPKDAHRKLLDRYGDMMASLNYQADAESVAIGFGQPYATYHEFGTTRMPRRGLLTADPEAGTLAPADEQAILDVLYDLLDQAINGV
ncbi:phage virion morphogenesis protein [Zoogloea sp.]|uniref:phage virion morphogenesis protein n=1 Tax=Zoogloea sp. TaxID=49181 RepID=UPI0025D8D994|nr:phage virion morphogenesis protein [Zoogloea sp.]MCK6396066.1 phage virion morphogenesis protein [Zoogloea sp.]